MKIYQETNFHHSGNVVVCVITAKINTFGVTFKVNPVRGIARCAPEDQFDLDKGRRIAESRAAQKLYKHISSVLNDALKGTYKDVEYLKNELIRVAKLQETEERHFDEICH